MANVIVLSINVLLNTKKATTLYIYIKYSDAKRKNLMKIFFNNIVFVASSNIKPIVRLSRDLYRFTNRDCSLTNLCILGLNLGMV